MSQSEAIDTIPYRGYNILIMPDNCDDSPREWDNLGKMVCFHRRYNLGDENDLKTSDFTSWDDLEKYLVKEMGAVVILPLYLYDHSGLAMSVGSFIGRAQHAEWDSGQVGFIYATKKDILDCYGGKKLSPKKKARTADVLEGEVETYSQYLNGEVYGFIIESGELPEPDETSCWGFYGDPEKSGLLADAKANIDAVLGKTP
jgi:hypothetical protein